MLCYVVGVVVTTNSYTTDLKENQIQRSLDHVLFWELWSKFVYGRICLLLCISTIECMVQQLQ